MSRRTDDSEDFSITGQMTILPAFNPVNGDGSIEVHGTVFSDNIDSNIIGGNVNLKGTLFNDKIINIQETTLPALPAISTSTLYLNNSKLKSIDSNGLITIYQPTTTKGDLTIHDGATQVRLPVGSDGYILVSNSSSLSGVSWVENTTGSTSPLTTRGDIIVYNGVVETRLPVGNDGEILVANSSSLNGVDWEENITSQLPLSKIYLKHNEPSSIIESPVNAWITCIYSESYNGSSCIFVNSRTNEQNEGICAKLCSNRSLITSGDLECIWDPYMSLQIEKRYPENDGTYKVNESELYKKYDIVLTGTNYTDIVSSLTGRGCFVLSIGSGKNNMNTPCVVFIICKSSPTLSSAAIIRLSSSSGNSNCMLNIKWDINSSPSVNKSNNNHNGQYYVTNNLISTTNKDTITLSGTNFSMISSEIFPYFTNKSFILSITGKVEGSPCAVFIFSKNSNLRVGSSVSTKSPGLSSGEVLSIKWDINSLLYIKKNGSNYDGEYDIIISRLI